MGTIDFKKPTVPRWKFAVAILAVGSLGEVVYQLSRPAPPSGARVLEGCPCGCDRSAKMAADLRRAHEAAPSAIERSLVTIGERESAGYITERMVQHRLRLLDLADELHVQTSAVLGRVTGSRDRCKVTTVEDQTLRICPELVVHGERTEVVDGHDKLIESCFRLWLEIENLTGE